LLFRLGLELLKLEEEDDFQEENSQEQGDPQEENTSEDSLQKDINKAYEGGRAYEEEDYECTAIFNPELLPGVVSKILLQLTVNN